MRKILIITILILITIGIFFISHFGTKFKEEKFEKKFTKAVERLIRISEIIRKCESESNNYDDILKCSNENIGRIFKRNIFVLGNDYRRVDDEAIITFTGRRGIYKIVIYKDEIIVDNYKYIKYFVGKEIKTYGLLGNVGKPLCEKLITRSDYYINDGNLNILVKGLWLKTVAKGIKNSFVEIYGEVKVKNSCIYIIPKNVRLEKISRKKFILNIFYKNGSLIVITPHPGHKILYENLSKENGLNKLFLRYIPPDPNKYYPQVLTKYEFDVKVKGWLLVYINRNLVFVKYI